MRRATLFFLVWLLAPTLVAAEDWPRIAMLVDGKPAPYHPVATVSRAWRLCALLPNGTDRFWWAVSAGLAQEAKLKNVKIGIYQAGGYENIDVQRQQFTECRNRHADAILLGAISVAGLDREIADASAAGVVIIDLINGVTSTKVTAHVDSSTYQQGVAAARYLVQDSNGRSVTVAWFPGPADADWVVKADAGVFSILSKAHVSVVNGGAGPPEMEVQMELVRSLFSTMTPDYVLGNAVAAEAAARYVSARPDLPTKVISYYATEPIVDMVRHRQILAAPSNAPVVQGRVGIDLALRALEGMNGPKHVLVLPTLLDDKTIDDFQMENLFPPGEPWMVQTDLPN